VRGRKVAAIAQERKVAAVNSEGRGHKNAVVEEGEGTLHHAVHAPLKAMRRTGRACRACCW
jgi:hypothetical protein